MAECVDYNKQKSPQWVSLRAGYGWENYGSGVGGWGGGWLPLAGGTGDSLTGSAVGCDVGVGVYTLESVGSGVGELVGGVGVGCGVREGAGGRVGTGWTARATSWDRPWSIPAPAIRRSTSGS